MNNGLSYILESGLLTENTGALKLYCDFSDTEVYKIGGTYSYYFLPVKQVENSRQLYLGEEIFYQPYSEASLQGSWTNISEEFEVIRGQKYKLNFDVQASSRVSLFAVLMSGQLPQLLFNHCGAVVSFFYDKVFTSNQTSRVKLMAFAPDGVDIALGNITVDRIDSEIKTFAHDITGDNLVSFEDYSYATGNSCLDLLGNRYNEESGIASYLQIENSQAIYSGNDFTFIIEGGKIPRDYAKSVYDYTGFDVQMPFHNKEIIFSNISGEENSYGGWEIGLNGANLLYFRASDLGQQKVLTYDQNTPYGENIWAVRKQDRIIYITRYDPERNVIATNRMPLGSDLNNGGEWYLNSGNLSNLESINTGTAANITSSIRLRKFLYFDEYLSDDQVVLASEFLSANVEDLAVVIDSGYSIYEGTGAEICSGVSGIVYNTGILSGYQTDTRTVTGEPVFTGISGIVNSGDSYYYEYDEEYGIFYSDIYTPGSGDPSYITGVTGYDWYYPTTVETFTGDAVYIQSGVSGSLYEECWTGTYLESGYFTETGFETGASLNGSKNLRARSFSYFGQRNDGDFGELSVAKNVWSGSQKIVNNQTQKSLGYYRYGHTLFVYLEDGTDESWMNLYLNGVAIRKGAGSPTKIVIDGTEYDTYLSDKDYVFTGNNEIFTDILFTGADQIENIHGVFDVISGGELEFPIVDLDEYYDVLFGGMEPSGRDMFFNGIKIYEGLDYDVVGADFSPKGYLTGMTGLYFSRNRPEILSKTTGESVYDLYGTGYLEYDSVLPWINGVRKDTREYLYHDSFVDLISGTDLQKEIGQGRYQGYMEI